MSIENLSGEDNAKLRHVIEEGLRVTQQIDDLRCGLKDVVKSIAEELELKPSSIMKAIKMSFKESLQDEKDNLDQVEHILSVLGKF